MQHPNFVISGINKISAETIEDSIMALGLNEAEFIYTNVGGLVSLLVNEKYEIESFKLIMLRATLQAFNEKANK